MTDGNESVNAYFFNGQDVNGEQYIDCGRGLTKRELFAAMAMQGFATKESSQTRSGAGAAALYAVRYADALIAELQKEDK